MHDADRYDQVAMLTCVCVCLGAFVSMYAYELQAARFYVLIVLIHF